MVIVTSASSDIYIADSGDGALDTVYVNSNVSVVDCEKYMQGRLFTDPWDCADYSYRVRSLKMAEYLIGRLNFSNVGKIPPVDLARATYEVALSLLSGRNPERDFELMSERSVSAGGATVSRFEVYPENVRAGIPSSTAWSILRPYLVDEGSIRMVRIN